MTTNTNPTTTTKMRAPPAPPTPLPAETEAYLEKLREQLSASRLGHLGRRIEMLARNAQETIDLYGQKVIVQELAGRPIELPVETTIVLAVRIACNGTTVAYDLAVGASPSAGAVRPEAKLASFAAPSGAI